MNHFKRILTRVVVKFRRSKYDRDNIEVSKFEQEILKISRFVCRLPDTKLSICNETNRGFIVSERLQIKIILKENKIILSNHHYYEVFISYKGLQNINRVFNSHVKQHRDLLEQEITTRAKTSLNDTFQLIQTS